MAFDISDEFNLELDILYEESFITFVFKNQTHGVNMVCLKSEINTELVDISEKMLARKVYELLNVSSQKLKESIKQNEDI